MVAQVCIESIVIGEGRRPLGPIEGLMQSIRDQGLLSPINVQAGDPPTLIAGLHRLEACRALGWTEIPAVIMDVAALQAELAEIDENLIRNELKTLERCEHLERRKRLYVELYPEIAPVTVQGGPGRGNKTAEIISPVLPFSEDAAAKLGVNPRTIDMEVQIGRDIAPEVKERIRDTPIADKKTDLLHLARQEPEKQAEAVERVLAGDAKNVKEALNQMAPPTPECSSDATDKEADSRDNTAEPEDEPESSGEPYSWEGEEDEEGGEQSCEDHLRADLAAKDRKKAWGLLKQGLKRLRWTFIRQAAAILNPGVNIP